MSVIVSPNSVKKIEGVLAFVSGVSGIIGFILDYPALAFILAVLFGIGTLLYFGEDIRQFNRNSRKAQGSKVKFWLVTLISNRLAFVFFVVGILVGVLAIQFVFKETFFFVRQAWVEEIDYEYQQGMSAIRLSALQQNKRSLNVLKIINPTIYHNDRYSEKDDEIRFQGLRYTTEDYDFGYFDVENAGYDPNNEILEPGNNFVPNVSDDTFTSFTLGNRYTFFIRLYNSETKSNDYVRMHFFSKEHEWWGMGPNLRMAVYISFIYNGSNRFQGLVTP